MNQRKKKHRRDVSISQHCKNTDKMMLRAFQSNFPIRSKLFGLNVLLENICVLDRFVIYSNIFMSNRGKAGKRFSKHIILKRKLSNKLYDKIINNHAEALKEASPDDFTFKQTILCRANNNFYIQEMAALAKEYEHEI